MKIKLIYWHLMYSFVMVTAGCCFGKLADFLNMATDIAGALGTESNGKVKQS